MRASANRTRDVADEMAAMYGGCDDPLHPSNTPSEFRDWQDFVDRVARPVIEAEDSDAAEQAAMKLYRTANPYYICAAMVMMDNRIKAAAPADSAS
jgi:hypothetical protein